MHDGVTLPIESVNRVVVTAKLMVDTDPGAPLNEFVLPITANLMFGEHQLNYGTNQ
jgi:hypothetical protein